MTTVPICGVDASEVECGGRDSKGEVGERGGGGAGRMRAGWGGRCGVRDVGLRAPRVQDLVKERGQLLLVKGREAAQQDVEDDARRPHVDLVRGRGRGRA